MENASKALIIAGAILISILLIGVGVMVMNGAQGGIDEAIASMSAQEKDMFNTKFTQYGGTIVKGTNVRALIRNIISSNSTNQDIEGKLVELDVSKAGINTKPKAPTTDDLQSNEMSEASSQINTGATYTVKIEYGKDTGLVKKVIVEKPSTSNT